MRAEMITFSFIAIASAVVYIVVARSRIKLADRREGNNVKRKKKWCRGACFLFRYTNIIHFG
jgi:hypothetical protein